MSHHLALPKISALTAVALAISQAQAVYKQGIGEYASVEQGEKIVKAGNITEPPQEDPKSQLIGRFNREGDPVRIIWYGTKNDADGSEPQKGAINKGQIYGSVKAQGKNTTEADDRSAALAIEAQGNGIDALGWVDPKNVHSVEFDLTKIENQGIVKGEVDLNGGQGEVNAYVNGYGDGNAISVIGLADFGKRNVQANSSDNVIADGYSGATGVSRRRVSVSRAVVTNPAVSTTAASQVDESKEADNADEVDFYGKDVKISVQKIDNQGLLSGFFSGKADQSSIPYIDDYKSQFYSVSGATSGNGVSMASYVNTIDRLTFSEKKTNKTLISEINNSGIIHGSSELIGGVNVTHTGTLSTSSGNGVSTFTKTGNLAKQKAQTEISKILNNGEISGHSYQISGKNSNYRGYHLYSDAIAYNSGNGVGAMAESYNGQVKETSAKIGTVENRGKIQGDAYLKAGSGYGQLFAQSYASGNGLSVYGYGTNESATMGDVNNKGVIKGFVEVHGGKDNANIQDQEFIPEIIYLALKANQATPNNNSGSSSNTTNNSSDSLSAWLAPSSRPSNNGSSWSLFGDTPINPYGSSTSSSSSNNDMWLAPSSRGNNTASNSSSNSDPFSSSLDAFRPRSASSGFRSVSSSNHEKNTIQTITTVSGSGNGISVKTAGDYKDYYKKAQLGNIDNNGVISGNAKVYQGYSQDEYSRVDYRNSGAGIAVNSKLTSNVINTGLISGRLSALLAQGKVNTAYSINNPIYESGYSGKVENYGIFAGRMILGNFESVNGYEQVYKYFEASNLDSKKIKNAGIHIYLDKDANIDTIVRGSGGSFTDKNGKTYQIINAPLTNDNKDSEQIANSSYQDTIINGAGIAKGALVVNSNTDLQNTIINGYKTAVKLEGNNNTLMATNSTLNANGFEVNGDPNTYAILGDDNPNNVTLDNTLVNANLDLGAGDDSLTIKNNQVKFNTDNIDLGAGTDTLTFGQEGGSGDPIKVDYEVKNAEKIEIKQETHFYSTALLKAAQEVNLTGKLIYGVENPDTHAFANIDRTSPISLKGNGDFVVDISKVKEDEEVMLNGLKFNLEDPDKIRFSTTLQDYQAVLLKDGILTILSNQRLEALKKQKAEEETKQKLEEETKVNKIANAEEPQSEDVSKSDETEMEETAKSEEPKTLDNATSEEHQAEEMAKSNEPKAEDNATSEESKTDEIKSVKNVATTDTDNVSSIYSALTAANLDNVRTYLGIQLDQKQLLAKGQSQANIVGVRQDNRYPNGVDATLNGVLTHIAYGIEDNLTLGVGAATGKTRLKKGGSKLDGSHYHINAYLMTKADNWTITAGLAQTHSRLKGTLIESNQTHRAKLNANVWTVFTEAKYGIKLSENWQFEPKVGTAYHYYQQHQSDNEGLVIERQNMNILEASAGQRLAYSLPSAQGKLVFAVNTDYVIRSGEKALHAHNQQGEQVTFKSDINKSAIRLGTTLGYQWLNGLSLKAGYNHQMRGSTHSNNVNIGLGYQF